MTYVYFIKVPKQIMEQGDVVGELIKSYIQSVKRRQMKQSHLWTPKEIRFFEQDADNFVQNKVTVGIEGSYFKIPRIVKRLYPTVQ